MFKNPFRKKKPSGLELMDLKLSEHGIKSLTTFTNRSRKNRMSDIMHIGDDGSLNYFYLIYYAVLFDPDKEVRFAALKRAHKFVKSPVYPRLLAKLEKEGSGHALEPYYSMMLYRIGKISKSELNHRINATGKKHQDEQVLTALDAARKYVADNFNSDKEETLCIAESLLDPSGVNMTIIADGILKKGFFPHGFEQHKGYRIYLYKKSLPQ